MKAVFTLFALLALIAVGFVGHRYIQTGKGEKALGALSFTNHTLQQGLNVAKNENKLVLADYSAIWCPTCRKLDEAVFADAQVSNAINDNFVYVRLEYDSDAGIAFAKKHDIQGFPRILVLDVNGEKVVEMPLVFNPNEYAQNLMEVVQLQNTVK